jgi:hypothetical protein
MNNKLITVVASIGAATIVARKTILFLSVSSARKSGAADATYWVTKRSTAERDLNSVLARTTEPTTLMA